MEGFLKKIEKQLKNMPSEQKDRWILSQAKILPVTRQEDFYKSLCGTKSIIDMPESGEISKFINKIKAGDVSVLYETHYVEFDDRGHFHDDWEWYFHDPDSLMPYISSVINGCHDLVILEEYSTALEILDELIPIKILIEDDPDTDDTCEDDYMDLDMAITEGMLAINRESLLKDYIISCKNSITDGDVLADKLVSTMTMKLFESCNKSQCIKITENDPLLELINKKLSEMLGVYEDEYKSKSKKDKYYQGMYSDEVRIRRIKELITFFKTISVKEKKQAKSFLRGTWDQIKDLIYELEDEPYIDDQFQIEEIWRIVEALLKRGGFDKEPWEVKEKILKDIYENEYYDYYGVYDPMKDLADSLCSNRKENLKRAGIMMNAVRGYLGAEAAKLYHELGEDDKCAEYFEEHLAKEEEPYEILIEYYKERNHEKAVEIAKLAIQKCQKNQTKFFIFLLQDARDNGDEVSFKKLMQSAHRRRAVNSKEVDAVFGS